MVVVGVVAVDRQVVHGCNNSMHMAWSVIVTVKQCSKLILVQKDSDGVGVVVAELLVCLD